MARPPCVPHRMSLRHAAPRNEARAAAVLQDLATRFPDDQDVRQALSRMQPNGPVTWTIPAGVKAWKFTGDKLLLERDTGLEAVGPQGASLWKFEPGGPLSGSAVYNENLTLAIVSTAKGGQLVDLQTGARLGDAPPVVDEKGLETSWRGDVLLHGEMTGKRESTYQVYRIVRNGNQAQLQPVGPQLTGDLGGTASPAGVLLTEPFESKAIFYRDGKPSATLKTEGFQDQRVAVAAAGDYVYRYSQISQMIAYDLTGRQLWKASLAGSLVDEWVRGKETWLVTTVTTESGFFTVLDSHGGTVTSGNGYIVGSSARHLLVSRPPELVLLDGAGKVVAKYPYPKTTTCGISPDGNWVYVKTGDSTLTAYPVNP